MAGGIREDEDLDENHEVNVTPFIDVILVLLIIFMVAAPLSTVDIAVDLPSAAATPQPRPEKPVFVTIKKDLSLAVGETPVAKASLNQSLDAVTVDKSKKDERIFIRADKTVPYEALIDVMNELRRGGYQKIALVGLEALDAASAQSKVP